MIARILAAAVLLSVACKSEAPAPKRGAADPIAKPEAGRPEKKDETTAPAAKATPGDKAGVSIEWLGDEGAALAASKRRGLPLLIDFSAEWCAPCQEMEESTFADPKVAAAMRAGYIALKIDVTDMNDSHEALMKKYRVEQLPVILVRDPSGNERKRWTDFVPATELLTELSKTSTRL